MRGADGTMQTSCLRLVGEKLLVALTMEGKFAGEGLQTIDEDDDMLSAMARKLVKKSGIGKSADAGADPYADEITRLMDTEGYSRFQKPNASRNLSLGEQKLSRVLRRLVWQLLDNWTECAEFKQAHFKFQKEPVALEFTCA
jgi:hypothetical protein